MMEIKLPRRVKEKHGLHILEDALSQLGSQLSRKVDAYLIGGCNLMLKGLKGATKDADLVFASMPELKLAAKALAASGYSRKTKAGGVYATARYVFDKPGFPSFDLFHGNVCGKLRFTDAMWHRSKRFREYGNLRISLASDEDVFLFKAVAGRKGDLDDCASLARRGIKTGIVLGEIRRQKLESNRDWRAQFASFALDLKALHGITIPRLSRVVKEGEKSLKSKHYT